ncbi:MAG: hypothetical protein M1837_004507 [Sclerophora amabilis]|nr:MAG: hypothetical protein M1837_004507 [Sclerophora amabilis]
MQLLTFVATVSGLLGLGRAQFPPTPEDVTVLRSSQQEGVTVSYKEGGLCETTEGVRSFSGYVHLPNDSLDDVNVVQDYPINTFFWFFESREDPENAPLSIWMNGGPGSSSMIGLLQENGPCSVNSDSNSTTLSPFSWNGASNMLYIDQPNQVGLSYDSLSNGTLDLTSNNPMGAFEYTDFSDSPVPEQNNTFLVGTWPSGDDDNTANSSMTAARAMWHFAQVWFDEFPEYKVEKFNIWTESYGGTYGPTFATFFEEQNQAIENGTLTDSGAYVLNLDTLGIINGCIDDVMLELSYFEILHNNSYGIQLMNDTTYEEAYDAFFRSDGCRDQLVACRDAADQSSTDANRSALAICADATQYCATNVEALIPDTFGYYDFAHPQLDPFPKLTPWGRTSPPYMTGFLNAEHVQRALGVPLNWTTNSPASNQAIGNNLYENRLLRDNLAYLLDNGIKVALIYGDRDWICNWYQGENVSLAVDYAQSEAFRSSGYTDLEVNSSYVGGQVRQVGNFSFTRIYQAGHEVPSYQPEAAYRVFERVNAGLDIATGTENVSYPNSNYSTTGPSDTFAITNEVPPYPEVECYTLLLTACTQEQQDAVTNDTAIIKDYFVVDFGNGTCSPNPIQPCGERGNSTTEDGTTEDDTSANETVEAPADIGTSDSAASSSIRAGSWSALLQSTLLVGGVVAIGMYL